MSRLEATATSLGAQATSLGAPGMQATSLGAHQIAVEQLKKSNIVVGNTAGVPGNHS